MEGFHLCLKDGILSSGKTDQLSAFIILIHQTQKRLNSGTHPFKPTFIPFTIPKQTLPNIFFIIDLYHSVSKHIDGIIHTFGTNN